MARIALVQDPRRRVVALTSAAVVVVVTLGLVGARGSRADAVAPDTAVPTATVTTRTMAVTSTVDGTVQRAARYEVTVGDTGVAAVAAVPDASTGGSGGGSAVTPTLSVPPDAAAPGSTSVAVPSRADLGSVALVAYVAAFPAGATVVPTADPTAVPTDLPTTAPTDTPTAVPTPDPSPTPTASPTPVPTTRPGTTPTTGTTPPTGTPPASSVPADSSASSRTGSVPTSGAAPTGSLPTSSQLPQSTTGQTTAGAASSTPTATLTALAALGTAVTTGTVLYAADGEPVVAVRGDVVLWRELEVGVDDGADVRALEEVLTALGYGDGVTIDETFTSVTAAAVERWESDLGRLDPDGVVALGDLVTVPDACEVTARLLQPGDSLRSGAAVLTIASSAQVISAAVGAESAADWDAGAPVVVEWSDGETSSAHVVATGRDVVDGAVGLTVAFDVEVPGRATGTPVTLVRTVDQRDGALTAPVAAIVADDAGRPSVVVLDGEARRQVPVSVGVVIDGWVEVSGDLVAGERVVLPG